MVLEEVSGPRLLVLCGGCSLFTVNYQPLIFLIYVAVTSWDINKKYIIINYCVFFSYL